MPPGPPPGASLAEIKAFVDKVNDAYSGLSESQSDPQRKAAAQNALVVAARQLVTASQAPHEAAMSIALSNALHPCILSASRCGILKEWSSEEMTADELAETTGADRRLIGSSYKALIIQSVQNFADASYFGRIVRIMRALLVSGIFKEVGEDKYSHNFLSKALCNPGLQTTMGWM